MFRFIRGVFYLPNNKSKITFSMFRNQFESILGHLVKL